MDGQTASAAAATLVAIAFAMVTVDRWLLSRRRHELAWSIALVLFAAAAGALWLGAGLGWSSSRFRAFYLLGAIVNVPVLALGTIYLLGGRRRGDLAAAGVFGFAAFATGVLVVAPLSGPVPVDALPQGSDVFGPLPRVLAAVGSSLGAIVLFAGAVWSALARWRRGGSDAARTVTANGLIALGTLVLSVGGLFNSVADEMTGFAWSLVIGIATIFAGFLVATAAPRAPSAPAELLPGGGQTVARDRRGSMRETAESSLADSSARKKLT